MWTMRNAYKRWKEINEPNGSPIRGRSRMSAPQWFSIQVREIVEWKYYYNDNIVTYEDGVFSRNRKSGGYYEFNITDEQLKTISAPNNTRENLRK